MVTKVGLQPNFISAIQDLLELDFDAIEAYEAAINRLGREDYKEQLRQFREDHVQHTINIADFLEQHHEKVPTGPSGKQWLTKGKVVVANLAGDRAILMAMISNEIDTNTAYERLNYHEEKYPDAIDMLKKGLEDERRHKAWLQQELDNT